MQGGLRFITQGSAQGGGGLFKQPIHGLTAIRLPVMLLLRFDIPRALQERLQLLRIHTHLLVFGKPREELGKLIADFCVLRVLFGRNAQQGITLALRFVQLMLIARFLLLPMLLRLVGAFRNFTQAK